MIKYWPMNGKKISWGPKYEVDKHESNSKQHDASSGPSKCPLSCEAAHLPTLTLIRRNIGMKSANNFDNLLLYNLQERTKKTSPSFVKKSSCSSFSFSLFLSYPKNTWLEMAKFWYWMDPITVTLILYLDLGQAIHEHCALAKLASLIKHQKKISSGLQI